MPGVMIGNRSAAQGNAVSGRHVIARRGKEHGHYIGGRKTFRLNRHRRGARIRAVFLVDNGHIKFGRGAYGGCYETQRNYLVHNILIQKSVMVHFSQP